MNIIVILVLIVVFSFNVSAFVVNRAHGNQPHDQNTLLKLKEITKKLEDIHSFRRYRSKRDAMDSLIYQVVADTENDVVEEDYDKSSFKAESVSHRLNERIEHISLVLTHLKDIAKHFESVHKMAKSLVESDATANFVKKFAIQQLNDSVNRVEKCDGCWN